MSLAVRHVSKAFGGFRALDDVSLELEAGALFGVIGPNGAGKSTLFAVMSGFLPADSVKFCSMEKISGGLRRTLARTPAWCEPFRCLASSVT